MPHEVGAKECQATELVGLPSPDTGTNGEVTAVSNHHPGNQRTPTGVRVLIVAGDN
jgi:hypothetical protein